MGVVDGEAGETPLDGTQPPVGPRRSTFTPAEPGEYAKFFASPSAGRSPVPIDAPPPSPATAVTPPPGSELPRAPHRISLPDADLMTELDVSRLGRGNSLDGIARLQEQLSLREQEAREFRNWERSMLAIGTPEALEVIEETRTTFTEAIQIIPAEGSAPRPPRAETVEVDPLPSMADSAPTPVQLGDEESSYELIEPEGPFPTAGDVDLSSLGFDALVGSDPVVETDAAEEPDPAGEMAGEVTGSVTPVEPEPETAPEAEAVVEAVPSVPAPEVVATTPRAFFSEENGLEPTPVAHRAGRSIRLFWLWFATNSSVVSLIFGGVLLSLGMSLRQAIVATLAGVALSFLPLGVGTLASKWSNQPTMVVSRASFGLVGNVVPALLALLTRLLWGAVLLWLLASVTAAMLVGAGLSGSLSAPQLTIIAAGVAFLIALVIAFFGYALLATVQLVLSVLSGVLIIILIVVSSPLIDLKAVLAVRDGPWVLVLTGAILVFSFVGLLWSTSSGDLARHQRSSSRGAPVMLFASFGAGLPAFVLIAYGALLAASNQELALGFVDDPIATLAVVVPAWFTIPLIGAVAIGLLSGVILSIYSGGFALQVVSSRLRRDVAVLIAGIALGAIAITMTLLVVDFSEIFRDLATTVAVPTAAWVGIFVAEVMIRNRRFDARSLVQPGGIYPATRWVNLTMLIVASTIGYGLTTASAGWLAWQGYLLDLVGIPAGSELAQTDIGVLVALLLALLTPIVAGIPAIRKQEAGRGEPDGAVIQPR